MQARSDHHETRRDPADERAVRELFEKLLEDWARGDGEAYGSRFTEDADYVAFDGTRTKGREEISSSHQRLFDKFMKGTRLTGRIEGVKFPVPGVALVHATGGTLMRGKTEPSPERDSIQTLVAVKREEGMALRRFPQHARPAHRPGVRGFLIWAITDRLWRAFGPGGNDA
jgi:uncharacterized protein (TIGR02246 family)